MQPESWSPVNSADAFSAFASILAALVFAGMVVLLGTPPKADRRKLLFYPALLMCGTFLSLEIGAFLFAALHGEEHVFSPHVYLEGNVAGAVIAISVAEMGMSLSWLLAVYGVGGERRGRAWKYIQGQLPLDASIVSGALLLGGMVAGPIGQHVVSAPLNAYAVFTIVGGSLLLPVLIGHLAPRQLSIDAVGYVIVVAVVLSVFAVGAQALAGSLGDPQVKAVYSDSVSAALILFGALGLLVALFTLFELGLDALQKLVSDGKGG